MDRKYKITIPEPCHEDWDKMIPNKNGRFCGSCSKNVVDFTNMMPNEIQAYFLEHSDVCGRFKNSQLDSLIIQIPNRVLYSQTHYNKMFLLALFIAMGTTLFSCADKNGNKQKIDKIEVVEDSIANETVTDESTTEIDATPRKLAQNKQHEKQKNAPHKKKFKKNTITSEIVNGGVIEEDNTVYGGIGIEIMHPEYNGGIDKFYSFIKENYKTPNKLSGDIQASFVIEKDGSLNQILITKGLKPKFDKELIRVLNLSPKWLPAEIWGKKTSIPYNLFLSIKAETIPKWYGKKTIYKIDYIEAKTDTVKTENKKISI